MRVLLIGGGNMGGAMIGGLKKYDLTVVEAYEKRANELKSLYPNIKIVDTIPNIDNFIVILAIKPQSFPAIIFKGQAKGVISIMAGVELDRLKQQISATSYIRSMPNMAALVGRSATAVTGDVELKEIAMEILSSVGSTIWLESENELNIAMAIASCSPAWMALVAEALSDGAVKCGLKREVSYQFVSALFDGMGELLKSEHPAILKDKVTSPGGTTAAGYAKLEETGVRSGFIKAVEAAYEKGKKI